MARSPQAHRAAGDLLIQTILDSPEIVALVAKKAIFEKVRRGELIEAHKLAVAPGMVLERAGHVDELNQAIDDALEALDAGDIEAAKRVLGATIPDHELDGVDLDLDDEPEPDEDDEPEPEPEPKPKAKAKKAAAKKAPAKKAAPAAGAPTQRRRARSQREDGTTPVSARRPPGYPVGHENYPCGWPDGCEERVPQGAAEISFTRIKDPQTGNGVILCVDHLAEAIAAE